MRAGICDLISLRKTDEDCDVVLHLGALIGIPYSYHAPERYVDINMKGTLNVVQAARDLGITKLVHTSTSEVYGTARFVPITEDHPLQGQSPYSATKIGADQLAMSFHTLVRDAGGDPAPVQHLRSAPVRARDHPDRSSPKSPPASALQLGSLHPTRDFNYVSDTVAGSCRPETDRAIGEVINIGSNFEISIGDAANTIAR